MFRVGLPLLSAITCIVSLAGVRPFLQKRLECIVSWWNSWWWVVHSVVLVTANEIGQLLLIDERLGCRWSSSKFLHLKQRLSIVFRYLKGGNDRWYWLLSLILSITMRRKYRLLLSYNLIYANICILVFFSLFRLFLFKFVTYPRLLHHILYF